MVLLIWALGKICEPGPIPSRQGDCSAHPSRPSPSLKNAHLARYPPNSTPVKQSPSPSGQPIANSTAACRSPRSSVGDSLVQNCNLDLIPGLAYYAQATGILGNLTGSINLKYSQCCILAGLYAGQLANSLESLSWMQIAARTICIMLSSEYAFGGLSDRE